MGVNKLEVQQGLPNLLKRPWCYGDVLSGDRVVLEEADVNTKEAPHLELRHTGVFWDHRHYQRETMIFACKCKPEIFVGSSLVRLAHKVFVELLAISYS